MVEVGCCGGVGLFAADLWVLKAEVWWLFGRRFRVCALVEFGEHGLGVVIVFIGELRVGGGIIGDIVGIIGCGSSGVGVALRVGGCVIGFFVDTLELVALDDGGWLVRALLLLADEFDEFHFVFDLDIGGDLYFEFFFEFLELSSFFESFILVWLRVVTIGLCSFEIIGLLLCLGF